MQIHFDGAVIDQIPVHLNETNPERPFAVLGFGPASLNVQSVDDAYKVIAAGIAALRLLDPDAPIQLADDADPPAGGAS